MRLFGAMMIALSAINGCWGADGKGDFFIGGGVGGVKCPQFLNALATVRQHGGPGGLEGAKIVSPFLAYVHGFQTGYNSEADGVYDIFHALGENAGIDVLYAIEPWCAKNPDKAFATGLLVISRIL